MVNDHEAFLYPISNSNSKICKRAMASYRATSHPNPPTSIWRFAWNM